MWLKINLETFSFDAIGWVEQMRQDVAVLLSQTGEAHGVVGVDDLRGHDYAQCVEIDRARRRIRFGRDYLGHFPLLYALNRNLLFIADEIDHLYAELSLIGKAPAISEAAVAHYLATGYVPQGQTLFEGIHSCESATDYVWDDGKLSSRSTFHSIDVDESATTEVVQTQIRHEAERLFETTDQVDVWCSGGVDSSAVALEFNRDGRRADLVTMGYDESARAVFGSGELPWVEEVARALNAPLRVVTIDAQRFLDAVRQGTASHCSPIIYPAHQVKYLLAQESQGLVVTGEGGDQLFGGVTTDAVLFFAQQHPRAALGRAYVGAHKRFYQALPEIMRRGRDLQAEVTSYFDRAFANYPGPLSRKLFYVNCLHRYGSRIGPENYYAAKRAGIRVRHPLFHTGTYQAVARLPDERRFVFPRKKNGTSLNVWECSSCERCSAAKVRNHGAAGGFYARFR